MTGIPNVEAAVPTASGAASIEETLQHHKHFWKFAAARVLPPPRAENVGEAAEAGDGGSAIAAQESMGDGGGGGGGSARAR